MARTVEPGGVPSPRVEFADSQGRSDAPVMILSAVGAVVLTAAGRNSYLRDGTDTRLRFPLIYGLGAAAGGSLGGWVENRHPSVLKTTLGTAVGTVPLLLVAGSDSRSSVVVIPALLLPVVGAWLGNTRF